jgi:hypothetical protein
VKLLAVVALVLSLTGCLDFAHALFGVDERDSGPRQPPCRLLYADDNQPQLKKRYGKDSSGGGSVPGCENIHWPEESP